MSIISRGLGKDSSSLLLGGLRIEELDAYVEILSSKIEPYSIFESTYSSNRLFDSPVAMSAALEHVYTSNTPFISGGFYNIPFLRKVVKLEEKEYALRYSITVLSRKQQLERIGISILKPERVQINSTVFVLANVIDKYPVEVAMLEMLAGHVKFNSLPLVIWDSIDFNKSPSLDVHNVVFSRNE